MDSNPWVCVCVCVRDCTSIIINPSNSGLSYAVFSAVMKKGYRVPTPIQRKVGMNITL